MERAGITARLSLLLSASALVLSDQQPGQTLSCELQRLARSPMVQVMMPSDSLQLAHAETNVAPLGPHR